MRSIIEDICVVLLVLSIATTLFGGGAYMGADMMKTKCEKDAAIAAAKQGAKDYERLRQAFDAADSVRADLARARAESQRVRRTLASREAELARKLDGAGAPGCEKLLGEALEFLGECRERYLGCAAKHDALSTAVR